jgi:hypothetical protein
MGAHRSRPYKPHLGHVNRPQPGLYAVKATSTVCAGTSAPQVLFIILVTFPSRRHTKPNRESKAVGVYRSLDYTAARETYSTTADLHSTASATNY